MPSAEVDFREYRLHRDFDPFFMPTESNLVTAKPDTGYIDPNGSGASFYKLCAVDVHGNLSLFALASPLGPLSVLATVVTAESDGDRVRLEWDIAANPWLTAELQRRQNQGRWEILGILQGEGSGRIRFDDQNVEIGSNYTYRLVIQDGDRQVYAGEVTVSVRTSVLILSARPNPGRGVLTIHLTLRDESPVMLELFDLRA